MRRQQPRPLLQPARLDQDILNQIPTSNLRQHTHRDPIRQPDQRTINSTRSHTAILEQPPIRDHHDTPNDPPNLAALHHDLMPGADDDPMVDPHASYGKTLKYARRERERRFLLRSVPPGEPV